MFYDTIIPNQTVIVQSLTKIVIGVTIYTELINMEIEILELLEGAKRARGLTVVIDVFRAFTFESYAFAGGAKRIYPIGDIEAAYAAKRSDASLLLAGERGGRKQPGFDFGNSPYEVSHADVRGRVIVHTTSAGTQGVAAAQPHADEILLGALVNAAATAEYIRRKAPEHVSLVAMGLGGIQPTTEDRICAEYLRALLRGEPYDRSGAVALMRATDGARFFAAESAGDAPPEDFALSVKFDCFDFALPLRQDAQGRYYTEAEYRK